MVFDLSEPGAKAIKSPMGGGWIIPTTDEGRRILAEYFGSDRPAVPIDPLGGEVGYIVEPYEAGDLAEYLKSENLAWTVE